MEKLSGIKAHTIRVWEQRYDLLKPKRTNTNIRYYEDEDLKFLLNITLLNKNGYKISKISKMSSDEISKEVAKISEVNYEYHTQLDALTISMIEMDEFKFDKIINANITQIGFERTMLEVIHPFLDKLSVLWLTGSIYPVQENFISCLIRQKITAALDSIDPPRNNTRRKFLVYLPKGERQELSILFFSFLLKARNFQVIYLGTEVSVIDLKDVWKIHKPDFIFTMITETFTEGSVNKYISKISETFNEAQFLVSGYQVIAQQVKSHSNIKVLASLNEAIEYINNTQSTK